MKTAVEWFAERIQSDKIFNFETVLSKAKEMEKEQIIDAYENGVKETNSRCEYQEAEQYYKETFKSE